jgi:hypothetical protein
VGLGLAMLGLVGCASLVNSRTAEVRIATQPVQAHCTLSGEDDYRAEIDSPAVIAIPRAAAPITVECTAAGYRRTVASLQAGSGGWIWGNSALIVGTAGAAVLGLVVDETLGSNQTFDPDLTVTLESERARALRARSRADGHVLDINPADTR